MIPKIIVLDTGVLSNCAVRIGIGSEERTPSESCREWLTDCERAGILLLVPAIIYYETLREIERRKAAVQRQRLVDFCFKTDRFVPLTTAHLERAALIWAQSQNSGNTTAGKGALDIDLTLCAQVQSLGLTAADYVVATTNTRHLTEYVNAQEWQSIVP